MSSKKKYYSLSELSESSIMIQKKIPRFGIIITMLVSFLLVGALTWMAIVRKTYVVKAMGLLTDERKENIMNTTTGSIKSINFKEGDFVRKGETIITLENEEFSLQINQLASNVSFNERKANSYKNTIKFINEYKVDDERSQTNPFNIDDIENNYLYKLCQAYIEYIKEGKNSSDATEGSSEKVPYSQSEIDQISFSYLQQYNVYSLYENYLKELETSKNQLNMYSDNAKSLLIKAEMDGYVHFTQGLIEGTFLSQSGLLGTITSNKPENYYFEVSISSSERSKIMVNDEVEIGISGISQTDYGIIKGKLVSISNDISQSQDGKEVYYVGKVIPNNTYLEDKRKNKINLSLGMIGECRIKYDESSYLMYLIEQLGMKLR